MNQLVFNPEIIGFINGRPVYRIAGGSMMTDDVGAANSSGGMDIDVDDPTTDSDDDTRDAGDDDDDDDDTTRDDGWTPPDKAAWERMRAALKNERRDRKRVQREYEEKVKNLTSSASATSEVEVEKARIAERNSRDAYWAEEIVRAKAEAEFAAQGATSEMAQRLSLLVNMKKVEWDERDREWDGLEDEIEDIIQANQDFFKPKASDDDRSNRRSPGGVPRPRVDGGARGGQGGAPRKKKSSAQLIADQALGRRNRSRR